MSLRSRHGLPSWREFLTVNPHLLAFGFAFTFFSCFGRTFFISLFGGEIRMELDLTPGEFSYIYSGATLSGVVLVPWLGRLIDEKSLRSYATLLIVGLIGASTAMGFVTHAVALFIVLFLFRLTGGSLMNHTAIVAVSRYFTGARATATAFISLGVPLAEALLPLVAVATMAAWGWRTAWFGYAIFLAIVALPLLFWLSKSDARKPPSAGNAGSTPAGSRGVLGSWPRKRVVRDPNFYRILPAYVLPTPIMTTLFFHQAYIAEVKSWSLEWIATCFVAFAAITVIASLLAGPWVDRIGPSRLLPFTSVPMIAGLVILATGTAEAAAMAYMIALGMTVGTRYTFSGALWVERYGADHLGAIRALVHTVSMSLYGIAPAIAGGLIDAGIGIPAIAGGLAVLLVVTSGLAMTATLPEARD